MDNIKNVFKNFDYPNVLINIRCGSYIPYAGQALGILGLFQKYAIIPMFDKESVAKNRYLNYIKNASPFHLIALSIHKYGFLFVVVHKIYQLVINYTSRKVSGPQIIGLLAAKRCGKDTTADQLAKVYGYEKYAFADPMKKAMQFLFQFSDDQLWGDLKEVVDPFWETTPRQLMQFITTDILREDGLKKAFPQINENLHIKVFRKWLEQHPNKRVVICDLRLQEDVYTLKKMGAFIIRIERPDIISTDSHISEAISSVTGSDATLINDGTLMDLYQKIDAIFQNQFVNRPKQGNEE